MINQTTPLGLPPVPQRVTSARLLIRPSRRGDAPYLQKWWNDPDLTGVPGGMSGMQYDDDDMEEWFNRYVDKRNVFTHFVICLTEPKERPIGEFYIASDDRPGCVGIALIIGERGLWGKGFAREALLAYSKALLGSGFCEAIRIDMHHENSRAVRMCEYVGFEVEHVWADGAFQTMILTEEALQLKHPAVAAEAPAD